jgi:hypothetical protein
MHCQQPGRNLTQRAAKYYTIVQYLCRFYAGAKNAGISRVWRGGSEELNRLRLGVRAEGADGDGCAGWDAVGLGRLG